ncbi:DJ-1/PfpI family protein [Mariniflexile soesokkakense]|uniref:DJ-1/PfpI family protein n=1 Tax=Mariniflexile soesokkakense TaxID=1343160 RepID=A0ABV0ADQ9_9FLAO
MNRRVGTVAITVFMLGLCSCNNSDKSKIDSVNNEQNSVVESDTLTKHLKLFKTDLPTIGLLVYNGVLITEVTASADVFTKPTENCNQVFNVVTIGETKNPIVSEEGLKIVPDYTFENCPKLEVLFVPSAYDIYAQVHNKKIVEFIKEKNKETKYTVSNCAGAQLIGISGIADGMKIVTWIGGGEQLQKDYPNLIVQNDALVTYVEDGKFSSSNGNLASYISALNLVEKMTNKAHRKFVESYLYLDRLQNWKQ